MANETFDGGRGDFPNLNQLNPVPGDVQVQDRPTTPGFGQFADDMARLSQTVGGMADKAVAYKGRLAGLDAGDAGTAQPASPVTIYGQAYNDAAKSEMIEQGKAKLAIEMGQAYADNPADPGALATKLSDLRASVAQTPFPEVNHELDAHALVQSADLITRAQLGLKDRMTQTAQANFAAALSTGTQALDGTAAGATFDAGGSARVAAAFNNLQQSLIKYGPRTAFSIGGVDYPADPTRGGMISPDDIEKQLIGARSEAKRTWILNRGLELPDQASKQTFIDQLHAKYDANDPIFQGLQGNEVDVLFRRLEMDADRTGNDAYRDEARTQQSAREKLEAWQWGGNVDPADMLATARASKDPALVAQAEAYAAMPQYTRGVLKSVLARQMGLIGGHEDPTVAVDATGQPVAQAAKPGAANPGMANPGATLEGVLGAGVNITSAARTAQHNAAVGGQPNSYHLTGHAVDFEPPPGTTTSQAVQKLKASGLPFVELLDEGDHVHVAWNGPSVGQAWAPPADVKPGTPAFYAWTNTKEGFSSDPIDYARGNKSHDAIASVPVLVPGAFAMQDNPAAQSAWASALQQRQATGQMLASRFAVPVRMLTNGERDFYKTQLQQNPAAGVALAQAASRAIGGDGARQLLREIGQDGPETATALHLGDLHAMGADGIVNSALQGLQIKAEGGKAPAYSKTDPDANLSFDTAQMKLAPALRYAPEALTAARNVAQLARTGDAARGVDKVPEDYLEMALGAQRGPDGRTFGGVTNVNGQYAYLPSWLSQDHAVDALQAMGGAWSHGFGPRYANGQVVTPQQAGRMQLAYRPNGHYWLVDPKSNAVMRGQGGAPFELDFDRARPFLSRVLPGAVLKGR